MSHSERGAVHIAWLIAVLLVALGVTAFAWSAAAERDKALADAKKATSELKKSRLEGEWNAACFDRISKVVGGGVPVSPPALETVADPLPDAGEEKYIGKYTTLAKNALKDAYKAVGDESAGTMTLVEGLQVLVNRYKTSTGEVAALQTQVKTLEAEVKGKSDALTEADKRRATDLDQLKQESDNAQARLQGQIAQLTQERDDAQSQNRKLTDEAAKTKDDSNKEVVAARNAMKTMDAQVAAIKNQVQVSKESETPDGKVLAVNRAMKTCFIDIGSKDKVWRGAAFRTYQIRRGNTKVFTGRVVVVSIGAERAECVIESEASGEMVGEGDMILSPIFDKSKTLHFVVLGELPGRYNREMATKILESHGVKIDSKVTVATDFVVLGMKDGEDADPAESEDYKKAQGWSIPVLRARDLEPFLQF